MAGAAMRLPLPQLEIELMARKAEQVTNRAVAGPAVTAPAVGMVTVKALGWIGENGETYPPGATFQVTAERAASLVGGKNVVLVK
jgi:hypothetical protein